MTHRTRRLVEGLAAAYRAAHPEETDPQAPPSAEDTEAAGIINALRQALYGTPPTATTEEEQ